MGKSVYILAHAKPDSTHIQLRKLKENLGSGLKTDGPFSDKGGAVADIAERVKSAAQRCRMDIADVAILTLMAQDKLAKGLPPSILEIPFIMGSGTRGGWKVFPENAGEVAAVEPVAFNGGLARQVCLGELLLLTASVLRMLDVESHLAMSVCEVPGKHRMVSETGVVPADVLVPAIFMPRDGMASSVIPDHSRILAASRATTYEVMDDDAFLSTILLENAHRHAEALMMDISDGKAETENERVLRCIEIGHMLRKGVDLWTQAEAHTDLALAKALYGPDMLGPIVSFREMLSRGTVRT